jgi:hypothetical protein
MRDPTVEAALKKYRRRSTQEHGGGGNPPNLTPLPEPIDPWAQFDPPERRESGHDQSPERPRPLMREIPPGKEFPVEQLGPFLENAARAIHDRIQAPLGIAAQSVLAAATLAVQAHADVELPIGQTRPISNFFVSLAVSGERKTSADKEAMRSVRKYETELRNQFDIDHPSYVNDQRAYDVARSAIERLGKANRIGRTELKRKFDELGPPPQTPLFPMLTVDEPTIQGLERNFAVSRPSLGLFSTEGGKFIAGHGMGDEHKVRTATGLSSLWDGDPIRRLRSGDGAMLLPGRRLAQHLAVQPEIAQIMLGDPYLNAQGLISRLLVVYPESLIGTRMHRAESPNTARYLATYDDQLLAILRHPLPLMEGKQNELNPRVLKMTPQANEMWFAFSDRIEQRMGDEFAGIRGFASKLPEHAARLAAVLALFDDIKTSELNAEYLARGIVLAQHYASEVLRTFTTMATDPNLMQAKTLLHWLHTGWNEPAVSLPDIYQLGPRPIRDSAGARKLVTILESHGWLVKIPVGAIIKGQKRREAWHIVRENAP